MECNTIYNPTNKDGMGMPAMNFWQDFMQTTLNNNSVAITQGMGVNGDMQRLSPSVIPQNPEINFPITSNTLYQMNAR